MAIVLPLLLLILFGIGEFSLAFTQWQTLINAAREGARVGVVFRPPASCAAGAVNAQITTAVNDYLTNSPSGLTTWSAPTISGACAGSGTPLRVTVTAPASFASLSALAGLLPTVTLTGDSTMRNE